MKENIWKRNATVAALVDYIQILPQSKKQMTSRKVFDSCRHREYAE